VAASDAGFVVSIQAGWTRAAVGRDYREGSPAGVVFLLTGQPGAADGSVNVSRPPPTIELCRAELSATRERCEAQAEARVDVSGLDAPLQGPSAHHEPQRSRLSAMLRVCRRSLRNGMGPDGTTRDAAG
jgi:hypothetical protein